MKCCFFPHCCFEFSIRGHPRTSPFGGCSVPTEDRPACSDHFLRVSQTHKSSKILGDLRVVGADSVHIFLDPVKHMGQSEP